MKLTNTKQELSNEKIDLDLDTYKICINITSCEPEALFAIKFKYFYNKIKYISYQLFPCQQ